MTLRLTPRQYKALLRMAWLSQRICAGSELHEGESVIGIHELSSQLYAMAEEFGAADALGPNALSGPAKNDTEESMFASELPGILKPEIEEELASIVEWYEEYSFWELLEDRMAMRDIAEQRSEAQWNWLPESEKDKIYFDNINQYFEDFAENGINNLRLQPDFVVERPFYVGQDGDQNSNESASKDQRPGKSSTTSSRKAKIIEFPGKDRKKPPL